jgi:hypothetical protein
VKIIDLLDLFEDCTTTPMGIGPKIHLRNLEIWSWGPKGNTPYRIGICENLEDAENEIARYRYNDFKEPGSLDIPWFWTKEQAQEWIDELKEEDSMA